MHDDRSVAIVGIGGIFPDAPDLDRFWDNIRLGRSAAREVPPGRWLLSADMAFDPEEGAPDRVYSRRGCFIDELPRLSTEPGFTIDQELLAGLDPLYHLLLHAGKCAFTDGITASLDLSRVGVIIGNLALPSEKSTLLTRQWLGRTFEEKLLGSSHDRTTTNPLNRYVSGLPAGLLAQALGLGGGSFTLDAACASSLYAIKLAVDELLAGRADAMLTGGLSRPDPLYTQMGFSQLRALSRRGICSPFDAAGDGLVVGEGAGIFLLKRTSDAVAAGDRIYGVIKGIGIANDVGGSLLAPLTEGQLRAMRAAYVNAGWEPGDVDLIECHATGTPVGDAVEFASLRELWGDTRPTGSDCVIGSVKSNIGHLLTAAGGAALTKVLLAMREETLPPTANFTAAPPTIALEQSPFRVLTAAIPWQRRGDGIPRRAALSAFGFGGINAHLLIEEWLPAITSQLAHSITAPASATGPVAAEKKPNPTRYEKAKDSPLIAVVGMDARFGPWQSLRSYQERVLGGDAAAAAAPPGKWWNAEESSWYREEGLRETPFAGFYLDEVAVAAEQFRIPPREIEEMLPQQLLMLQTAAAAMADAGIGREGNLAAGVFIGITLDLNSTNFSFRWSLAERAAAWSRELGLDLSREELDAWIAELRDAAGPPLTANRTMGALGSVVASRIAREFRCGGPGFTLSNEENSGIRALETAVRLLQTGELDRALVGAVDLAGDLRGVLSHHAVHAMSRTGSGRPFDTGADGSIAGEGAAAVVLKRLDDAERDGDRIYAVIRGIGCAGGAPLVSSAAGFRRALERAYSDAEVKPGTVDYLEAHGSGHPDEDLMEAAVLATFFNSAHHDGSGTVATRRCAVSSVKGDIGHCGAASGLASFIRGCLALYQEIIPACRSVETPLPELAGSGRFYLPRTPRYWLRNRAAGPRRAGVSTLSLDGTSSHVVLEGWGKVPRRSEPERIAPLGAGNEFLFAITGESPEELSREMDRLRRQSVTRAGDGLAELARVWHSHDNAAEKKPLAVALVARNRDEFDALLDLGKSTLAGAGDGSQPIAPPSLRDRLFYAPAPLGAQGKVAFVFPGSGNHYPGMGMEWSSRWPEIFRSQDTDNLYLRSQFQPELFWNGAPLGELDNDQRGVIFGQVAAGCAVSDLVRSFGVQPQAIIGYSLGESAGLFALGAWRDRDGMLARMNSSTLFTSDLAGECRAARSTWGLNEASKVEWSIGVVEAAAVKVRRALQMTPRVYLLIINTPDECVIGGDAKGVKRLVAMLGCRFFPLHGVTTVHCEVAREVAQPYRDLHLFATTPPAGIAFYSGARGSSYEVNRETAADSILAQALEGIDFPKVIETAYEDGVRIFLEMGPGSSCSRMISRILAGRPHLARSVSCPGQDQNSTLLRLLAQLIAERAPVRLDPLDAAPPLNMQSSGKDGATGSMIRVHAGSKGFRPPLPVQKAKAVPPLQEENREETGAPAAAVLMRPGTCQAAGGNESRPGDELSLEPLLHDFATAQEALLKAHEAYLRFANGLAATLADTLAFEISLRETLGDEQFTTEKQTPAAMNRPPLQAGEGEVNPLASSDKKRVKGVPCVFDRDMCLEFARGSAARMLGPAFAVADGFPTRVRLPDEPLMLVDRIITLEGEALTMTSGRVVTEHDILPGAWYLDGGCIPTCIAVEAGQADLFLSGYLGIDFITRGLAVYRLLDAVVTFHRGLPGPGATITYDIRIERFFRQGETYLFRFRFDATVDGVPLLTMRDGCAGFFTSAELDAGKGIVRPALDLRPGTGDLPADWVELVPMAQESYDAGRLNRLRAGDLAGCFGPLFAGISPAAPLTIPGERMRLVHRVTDLVPRGGRYGLGFIRAEADISPSDWFLTCHFVDDRVMPGTLMYECCLHTLRIFLLRMGWIAETKGSVWEPVPGVASALRCRGQVLETTKIAAYEVSIRELGYRPEPYAIVDALMFADGRPIVEITNMSVRLTGTSREKLLALWQGSKAAGAATGDRKPALYTKEQILAYSNGKPSEAFGAPYRPFDAGRVIARLPGPPYQFMDRITRVAGEPWRMEAGALAEAEYDVPPDAWYFAADRQPRMPFAILLEVALQPCGWLAAYVGSALTSPTDLSFRNLGGSAVQHRPVTRASGTLTATASLKKVATSGGMIIQEYDFTVADGAGLLYEGDTMFGFFSKESLAKQVGIRDAAVYAPAADETGRGRSLPYPDVSPFPAKKLRMIDRIELFVPDGGPAGLGYLKGIKEVDPGEWFFQAHFYQDPVTPGSLGLESFLQLLRYAAVDRWGWRAGEIIAAVALERRHRWLYRGQIAPSCRQVTVEARIIAIDDQERLLTADGYLAVDGRIIYQMNDFTVQILDPGAP